MKFKRLNRYSTWCYRFLLGSILFGFCSVSNALISWNTTEVTQKVDPLTASVNAVFAFENIGDKAFTITEVKSSCGCTTAALGKKTYAPGESGEINAKFNIGSR